MAIEHMIFALAFISVCLFLLSVHVMKRFTDNYMQLLRVVKEKSEYADPSSRLGKHLVVTLTF